jgi:hypothetical protein
VSRLDSAIRRLEAQRACLNAAKTLVDGLAGPVLELGLGNGRTFDHLRSLFPEREIFVFEREVAAHPDCVPEPEYLLLGDFKQSVPVAGVRIKNAAALIHYDIGTGDKAASVALASWLVKAILPLTQEGTVLVGDQPMVADFCLPLPNPTGVASGRYYIYQIDKG